MSGRNASASSFGWNFQANCALLLMLENIKDAKKVRVEGADEDIEITLQDRSKIYAQAKSIEKPDDTSHVIDKLSKALVTLSDASKKGDGALYTYMTNSSNPFNSKRIQSYFTGRTHLSYDELPEIAQRKIDELIIQNNITDFDVHKMDIRVIPFYGDDLKNRYKEIQACVNEFLANVNVDIPGINAEVLSIWQRDLFQNSTQSDTDISISKEKLIWPLIVLVIDKTAANDYKKDFNDDEIGELDRKYKMIINMNTMSYSVITRILTDYKNAKKSPKQYVSNQWRDYLDIVENVVADDNTKESLVKIILYRILIQRQYINDIKRGVNL